MDDYSVEIDVFLFFKGVAIKLYVLALSTFILGHMLKWNDD